MDARFIRNRFTAPTKLGPIVPNRTAPAALPKRGQPLGKRNGKSTSRRPSTNAASSGKYRIWRELDTEDVFFPPRERADALRQASTGNRTYTMRLGYDVAVTSDGSGIIASVLGNTPANASAWATYAALFEEYRVLDMTVHFEPLWATGGGTTIFWAPISSVVDRTDATALASYQGAERYESHHKVPGQIRFTRSVNMASVEDGAFTSTASPVSNNWIKLFSTGNTASTTVGRMDVVYLVQFRGLGI